jgi:hypothetical protein
MAKLTKTERKAIRSLANWRVIKAYGVAGELTAELSLRKRIARLLLTLGTDELSRIRNWEKP